MNDIVLNGITWAHSRGITPLQAAAQRFSELHAGISIQWKKRSLQEFADYPIEQLTHHYDLLIIDHPWVGCAAATQCVLPLNKYLPPSYLEQQDHSAGYSHKSYQYNGEQWALAIDAATPVASYRADLLEKHGEQVPGNWEALLALAKKGKVAVPSIPIDLLMHFYMFCIANGKEPFRHEHEVIDHETGLKALEQMNELWNCLDEKMYRYNPIAVAEQMSSTDDYWYCPFAYGYANYSRRGYAMHPLSYTGLLEHAPGIAFRSTLGGTGLAVSAFSKQKEWALKFAAWVVSPALQSTLYVQHGGQPGHRSAWLNEEANENYHQYFNNTLYTIDNAYVRPRYNGYLEFQDQAGTPLQHYIQHGGNPSILLETLNGLYRESRKR